MQTVYVDESECESEKCIQNGMRKGHNNNNIENDFQNKQTRISNQKVQYEHVINYLRVCFLFITIHFNSKHKFDCADSRWWCHMSASCCQLAQCLQFGWQHLFILFESSAFLFVMFQWLLLQSTQHDSSNWIHALYSFDRYCFEFAATINFDGRHHEIDF